MAACHGRRYALRCMMAGIAARFGRAVTIICCFAFHAPRYCLRSVLKWPEQRHITFALYYASLPLLMMVYKRAGNRARRSLYDRVYFANISGDTTMATTGRCRFSIYLFRQCRPLCAIFDSAMQRASLARARRVSHTYVTESWPIRLPPRIYSWLHTEYIFGPAHVSAIDMMSVQQMIITRFMNIDDIPLDELFEQAY